jgi:FdhD protein
MIESDERKSALWTPQGVAAESTALPEEVPLCIQINGSQLISIAASPTQREALVLGFLHYAGLIRTASEVRVLHFSHRPTDNTAATQYNICADVWLDHDVEALPAPWMRTSGCGSGVILGELREPPEVLQHPLQIMPELLIEMRQRLQNGASMYHETRGVHASGLFTPEGELLALAEDIGRHNTLDKLLGLCLMHNIKSDGMILFTTGRISSEMMSKAAWLRTPIVGSMTAPSSLAAALAETWGITIAGYVRSGQVRIYTHPWRILGQS